MLDVNRVNSEFSVDKPSEMLLLKTSVYELAKRSLKYTFWLIPPEDKC